MEINKEILYPYLMFNQPIMYKESIALYPIQMKDILSFQLLSPSICVRKNSRFPSKKIIKMSYLEFLLYAAMNENICEDFGITDLPNLQNYLFYAIGLLKIACRDQDVELKNDGTLYINDTLIDPQSFDELRKIIIIQNDIDFDVDEFMNYDTEKRLQKAEKDIDKNVDKTTIEDYIDSLCVALHRSEDEIMNMTIRKFWRFIKRYNLHESYTIAKTGECSGMVSYKEPIKHWMVSLETDDKYANVKTNEQGLKNKING